jgi:hypothetical protein
LAALAFFDLSSKVSMKLSSSKLSDDGIVGDADEGIAVAVGKISSLFLPIKLEHGP